MELHNIEEIQDEKFRITYSDDGREYTAILTKDELIDALADSSNFWLDVGSNTDEDRDYDERLNDESWKY